MEWLTCIRKSIDFMEDHLEENISAHAVADGFLIANVFRLLEKEMADFVK